MNLLLLQIDIVSDTITQANNANEIIVEEKTLSILEENVDLLVFAYFSFFSFFMKYSLALFKMIVQRYNAHNFDSTMH